MTYDHWTKIDDGAEGAWAADVWFKTLEIIKLYEGEQVYDADSEIYEELEREIPELTWRTYGNGDAFRPYFRDFSKPWTLTNVASFDGEFRVTDLGKRLLNSDINEIDFWVDFLIAYEENGDYPFVDICSAFLKVNRSINLEEIYWGVVRSYRSSNEDNLNLTIVPNDSIPSMARRRLMLMLQLIERTAGILKIGSGAKQRWKKWDKRVLKKIAKSQIEEVLIERELINFSSITKPFLLLAGISGTGKTRFVREQAKRTGSLNKTYCLIPVRPDWHEPSDLLGYISRLNGQAEYVTTDVLQFIASAWRSMLDAGLQLKVESKDPQDGRLVVTGSRDDLSSVPPYWLCLDEMNLAPVEQYFADYLSVLETREWNWDGDSFFYMCDSLLKASTIEQVFDINSLRTELGFGDENYDKAWALFREYGLGIPLNLIVAGTVNMDETTHGFSRKVIDRALSFDFGEFFPNEFERFFIPVTQSKVLNYPIWTHANYDDLPAIDSDGKKTVRFLMAVNEKLEGTSFKLAFRALNEILLAVISQNPQDERTLKAVWDDFLMCKVLPRIEGDVDKLKNTPSLLEELIELLKVFFSDIWDEIDGSENARPDLHREKIDSNKNIRIPCRSKLKLIWMQNRLEQAGFTSFWP